MTTRAFPMKSNVPPMASLVFSAWDPQGYCPKKVMAVWLAPMWKCTGSRSSAQASQKGSQALLARSGAPRSWGSDVMFTPRAPRPATRRTSLTHVSTSHAGISGSGSSRLPESAWISAMASL